MIKILILMGKTASGKDSVIKRLVQKHNYKKIITYTTRSQRRGEKQDVTYHFISKDDFKQKIQNGFFAEYKTYDTEFGTWYYGSALEDLETSDYKSVIILTPQGYRDVKDRLVKKDITCIYLYANNETLKKRLEKRGDDPKEAERRLRHDNEDFKGIENEVDRIVYNNDGTNIDEVVGKILDIVKEKK